MLIHPGHHIGDSWYTIAGDTIHCYYLTCPDSIERHTAWDIGHATSTNLVDWDIQSLVLRKGPPGSYDGRCPATGSVLRFNDRYWLAVGGTYIIKPWLQLQVAYFHVFVDKSSIDQTETGRGNIVGTVNGGVDAFSFGFTGTF